MTRTTKLTSKIYSVDNHFAENKKLSDFREYEYVNKHAVLSFHNKYNLIIITKHTLIVLLLSIRFFSLIGIKSVGI